MTGRWLDRKALAAHLHVPPGRVARLQRAGKLPRPSYHLGPKSPRWDRDAVDSLLGRAVVSTEGVVDALVQEAAHAILVGRKGRSPAAR